MRKLLACLWVCSLALLGAGGRAHADDDVIEYLGPHPIHPKLAKGMCHIAGPHFHDYQPHKQVLYVHADEGWVFAGDPTEFDRQSPRHGYYGHHPLFWVEGPEVYCYISGPHYHWFAPPPHLKFKRKGGVHWYVGGHPAWYKARAHRHLDEHYAAVHLVHPVVTVAPPVGFVGVVVEAPGVHVVGPSVHVGFPGVIIGGPVHHGRVKYKHGGHGWGHGHYKVKGRGRGKWK